MTSVNFYERFYTYIIYLFNILYLFAITGFYYINPKYIETVRSIAVYYVILLLFILFNPFYSFSLGLTNVERSKFERKVAFSSGMFLLFTMGITKLTTLINYK
jgi:hypothetical protein